MSRTESEDGLGRYLDQQGWPNRRIRVEDLLADVWIEIEYPTYAERPAEKVGIRLTLAEACAVASAISEAVAYRMPDPDANIAVLASLATTKTLLTDVATYLKSAGIGEWPKSPLSGTQG